MKLSRKSWNDFLTRLRKVNTAAADAMSAYMADHPEADLQDLIRYAYALCTRYGEASAALSAEMYDRAAAAQGAHVPPAEPAETATYDEVARAVAGTAQSSEASVPQTVGRMVKRAGVDTTLQNAIRDRAEFAWIPHGDTCPFCLMLGSNGWQRASRKAMRGGHAEHIHANCDCTYAVRFDERSTVAGYAPQTLLAQYSAADGHSWADKINTIRREQYARNADEINAQKRAAYAARQERED